MKNKLLSFNINMLLHAILKYGSILLVVISIVILALLSFVTNIQFDPELRNVTIVTAIALVLNVVIWDTFYKDQNSKVLSEDIKASGLKRYSVHKRYYDARKGFTQQQLRANIRKYNQDFVQSWLDDIEDITGRKIEDTKDEHDNIVDIGVRNGGYRGNSHKFLIWRVKHRLYPKSGIKSPRQLLNMLSVGKSDSMKIHTNAAKTYHTTGRLAKTFTSLLGALLGASIVYDFITDNWETALIRLAINILLIVMSIVFGSASGIKGAQIQLSSTEEVCELLEEWKHEPAELDKYGDILVTEETTSEEVEEEEKKNTPIIQIE